MNTTPDTPSRVLPAWSSTFTSTPDADEPVPDSTHTGVPAALALAPGPGSSARPDAAPGHAVAFGENTRWASPETSVLFTSRDFTSLT
ncbi:hypothetical protein [Kitasatospora purpeofusca]|uniref:hypothetical protein n=1 Tax=Kitasatospora purpeofusca TaxID=67352 RepID=UPI0036D41327